MASSNITNAARLAGLNSYTGVSGSAGAGDGLGALGALGSPSAAVLAKVEKAMSAQSGVVSKLNQNISSDQTKLSGLGQLQSALADFQSVAARLADSGKSGKADAAAPGSADVARNVTDFASAYNALQDKLAELGKGTLQSDPALAQAGRDLAGLLRNGSLSSDGLARAGVTIKGDGHLQIDDKQLKSAAAADPAAVASLLTNDGKGLAEQFNARIAALTGNSGAIGRETRQVNKELTSLNTKKADMTKALTAQANILAKLYAAQEQSASDTSGTGGSSPFDFLA